MLHVSIKPEVVFELAGFPVTNSILASWVLLVIFLFIALLFSQTATSKTSKFAFFIRFVLTKLYEFFKPIAGNVGEKAFPIIASMFLFILLANWMGLLPGFGSVILNHVKEEKHVEVEEAGTDEHIEEELVEKEADDHSEAPVAITDESHDTEVGEEAHGEEHASFTPVLRGATADLNMTLALALVAFVVIQYFGLRELKLGYLKKFINFSSPINFFIGILEIISEISKIISFAFRLFGNIFAGEVLLVVIAFLIPVLASFPFLLLEVFVGVVQALVFAMLTAVFINLATQHH